MPDVMDTVARCAPSAEAAERITRVAARMAYFDGAGGMLTMPATDNVPWTCPECEHNNESHAILCHGCGWDSAR